MAVRLLLWMFFGLTLMQALFLVGSAILPLETAGPPAYDRPLLRSTMWGASGQPLFFAGTVLTALLSIVLGPRPRRIAHAALIIALLLAAHVVLLSETGLLINGTDLAMPINAANRILLATRVGAAMLGVAATGLAARHVVGQLVRTE